MTLALPRLFGLLGLTFVVAAASLLVVEASPAAAGAVFGLAAVLGLAVELVLRRVSTAWHLLERHQLGYTLRTGLRDLVMILLAALWSPDDRYPVVLVTLGAFAVAVCRFVVTAITDATARARSRPLSWRNLDVPGVRRAAPVAPALLGQAGRATTVASALVAAGLVAALLGAPRVVLTAATLAGVAVAAVLAAVAVVDLVRALGDTSEQDTLRAVAAALAAQEPQVVLYYSRPERTGYIANVWTPILEHLPYRCFVLVREQDNLPLVETGLPAVAVTKPNDLEQLLPPSIRVALYPSNVANNNHLIRLPGIVDVFVGHGDSDKGGSATTLTRVYDEVWVSGPAARDRYRVADVGVRDEAIREIGRPQLAQISRAGDDLQEHENLAGVECTVLYAPTREGFFAEWAYSSVLTQGAGILGTLLALPGVRVLFKPHPGTGTDDPAYALAVAQLRALVDQAGPPHEVVTGEEGLYHAFNRADVLVSDVSSVITDFLASGKPYIVTNSGDQTPAQFRATYPSAAGAYILSGDGTGVAALLRDARERDTMRQAREQTAAYLLGSRQDHPLEGFTQAVGEAIERAAALRPA